MNRIVSLFLSVSLALVLVASAVSADPGDEFWSSLFSHSTDLDGPIHAMTMFDGDVIVGGDFTLAGNVELHNVARWDGTGWRPFGHGLSEAYRIDALIEYDGYLYADQWRWDGETWSEVFVTDGSVSSMTIHDGQLVVGGSFDTINGTPVNNLFAWAGDGPIGLGDGCDGRVMALLSNGDELYVGGAFSLAGGLPVSNLAVWDGAAWSDPGGGVSGEQEWCCGSSGEFYHYPPYVTTLCALNDIIHVGGQFTLAGTDSISALARWDGASWSAEEDLTLGVIWEYYSLSDWRKFPPCVQALAVDSMGRLVAGGRFTVPDSYLGVGLVRRDAGGWDLLGGGLFYDGSFYLYDVKALLSIPEGLLVGGRFFYVGDEIEAQHAALWNDVAWAPNVDEVGLGTSGYVFTSTIYQDDLIFGGSFTCAGELTVNSLARFDGEQWSKLGTTGIDGVLTSVRAMTTFEDDLIIGGRFIAVDGVEALNVARWNGSIWQPLGEGLDCLEIAALCVHDGNLYAAGGDLLVPYPNYVSRAKQILDQGFLYLWSGASWELLAVTNETHEGAIRALASYDGCLVIGGSFTTVGDAPMNGIATWDGASFAELGGGLRTNVRCLKVGSDGLYVGGWLPPGATPLVHGILRWNGEEWHNLAADIPGPNYRYGVYDLMLRGDRLYAAGQFESVNGIPARGVAVLDDGAWRALGSGVTETATTLAWYYGNLYVGGSLTEAGGQVVGGLARWEGEAVPIEEPDHPADPTAPPAAFRLVAARPNPFNPQIEIVYDVDRPQFLRATIYDARGRSVAVLAEGHHGASTHTLRWDGRDDAGRLQPSGSYFVELQGERSQDQLKITLVR
jgi:trimeric autotransporter adhesin